MTGIENYTRTIEFKGSAYLPCTIGVNLNWLHDKDEAKCQIVQELASRFPSDMLGWLNAACNAAQPETRNGVTRWNDE